MGFIIGQKMKTLLLILLLVPMISFGQTSSHIISGIDLNKDWFTLTNQASQAYWMQEKFRKENNLPGVGVELDKKYLSEFADKALLKIGFTDFILIFPQGNQKNLDIVEPMHFYAKKTYPSEIDYDTLNEKDFANIAYILMLQYGAPNKTMKKHWGAMFEWNFENAKIVLNTNKTDHINLSYIKLNL